MSIAVNFSSSVTVTGVPQLTLVVGTNSASAQYVSGSPGTALLFNYIVADGHSTDSLAYSSANALSLNGGSIQSTDASTLAADLTLPEPGTFGSLSGNFFPVVIDNTPPAAPSIDSDLIADDDNISVAERNADDGVQITGTQAADVITVTLCVGATDAADPLCEGGLTYDAAILPLGTTFAPAWGYSLDAVDFTDIGAGEVTLTAIATDAAGNTAVSPGRVITVDAILPGIDDPVAGDNIISAAERDFNAALSLTTTDERRQTDGVLITGSHDNAARITLCAGATDVTDANCADGTTFEATRGTIYEASRNTIWHYALDAADITAIGEGDVTLTAIATDNIGTASVSPGHDIIVDTTAPTVNSASVNVGESSIVVTFSEELGLTSLGVNTFTNFTLSGTAAIVTTVSTAGNTLTLTLDRAITAGTVTLDWSAVVGAFTGEGATEAEVFPAVFIKDAVWKSDEGFHRVGHVH